MFSMGSTQQQIGNARAEEWGSLKVRNEIALTIGFIIRLQFIRFILKRQCAQVDVASTRVRFSLSPKFGRTLWWLGEEGAGRNIRTSTFSAGQKKKKMRKRHKND